MASGNFLIGEQGLSLQGFADYVEPALKENGCKVNDKLAFGTRADGRVLVSLEGVGPLETMVGNSLVTAAGKIRSSMQDKNSEAITRMTAHNYQVHPEDYTPLGIYNRDSTASELFPVIAQKYFLEVVRSEVGEISKALGQIGKKLSPP